MRTYQLVFLFANIWIVESRDFQKYWFISNVFIIGIGNIIILKCTVGILQQIETLNLILYKLLEAYCSKIWIKNLNKEQNVYTFQWKKKLFCKFVYVLMNINCSNIFQNVFNVGKIFWNENMKLEVLTDKTLSICIMYID